MKFKIIFLYETALHFAIYQNDVEMVKILLSHKDIDINYKYIYILIFIEFKF